MENMAKYYIHEIPEGYEARIEGNKVIIELAESEDERMIRILKEGLEGLTVFNYTPVNKILDWLEKQKTSEEAIRYVKENHSPDEVSDFQSAMNIAVAKAYDKGVQDTLEKQKEQIPYTDFVIKPHKGDDNNPYDMRVSEAQEYAIKRGFGIPFNDGEVYVDERHMTQTIGNILRWADEHPKEQKPASTEDMPYITDEHFFEREPVDSFRYKLAKYMTQNCRKEESPDGYTYHISAETILQMAKEELIKRGVVQKPVEWSEEDEDIRQSIIKGIKWERDNTPVTVDKDIRKYDEQIAWLKSLRPSRKPSEVCYGAKGDPDPAGVWKPSEEQMNALNFAITHFMHETCYKNPTELRDLYEQLKKLM